MNISELKAALEKNLQGLGCGKTTGHGYSCDKYYICAECGALKAQAGPLLDLIAENEALRKALREVMTQVDGNIRETVRDCVNGHNDVQDIYGYCDAIEAVVGGALLSE